MIIQIVTTITIICVIIITIIIVVVLIITIIIIVIIIVSTTTTTTINILPVDLTLSITLAGVTQTKPHHNSSRFVASLRRLYTVSSPFFPL